jgi:hypothetical protein
MYKNPDNINKLRTILIQNVVLNTSVNVNQDKAFS